MAEREGFEPPVEFSLLEWGRGLRRVSPINAHWVIFAQKLKLPTHVKQVVLEINDFLKRSGAGE